MAIITRNLIIHGMHCTGCEDIIHEALRELPSIRSVSVSYSKASLAIEYDDAVLSDAAIAQCLDAKGYSIQALSTPILGKIKQLLIFVFLLMLVGGVAFWGKSQIPSVMQQIKPQMSYAVLLGIGFLTGFHCIGMCGGFVVGYSNRSRSKARQLLAHLSYALGKTISYTVLGAGFGLLGATVAITPQIRGILALAASVFLLIYGLKMLNVFVFLRRFTVRLPKLVERAVVDELRKPPRSAMHTGLLTGLLLGCGPLQAMYVMAAGSGDPYQGGMILLIFGLGTLPPLLGFGIFASLLPHSAMRQMIKVSGILVMTMGVMMAQRGMMTLKAGQMQTMSHQPMQSAQ